jgi:YHS domain-containing protein/TusA-related sulfurtransferase
MNNRRLLAVLLAFAFVFVLTGAAQQKSDDTAVDPVCGMTVKKAEAKATYEYKGATYYFCNPGCKDAFVKEPEKFLQKQGAEGQAGMMHPQGKMMHPKMTGENAKAGGCPMMQGKTGEGSCGMMGKGMKGQGMPGQGMMGHGMMAGGCCADCPMMDKDVEKKVENTPDGAIIKITSKNPETVKKIQAHAAKMAEGCPMMKDAPQQEAPKPEKK